MRGKGRREENNSVGVKGGRRRRREILVG